MQRDLEISEDCGGGGGGDGVIGATKEREVEMTIPFAEHNASHFRETKEEPLCREEAGPVHVFTYSGIQGRSNFERFGGVLKKVEF